MEHKENDENDMEKDETKLQAAIEELRALVSEEKKLKVRMDDNFMLRYLRASDYNPKEGFNKMEKFYKFKAKHNDYMCCEPPSKFKEFISQNVVSLLEDYNHDGKRVLYFQMGNLDMDRNSLIDLGLVMDLWIELAMDEEGTQKNGIHYLVDLGGMPFRLFKFYSPKPTILYALREEIRPLKNMDIHLVNTSRFLDLLLGIVFPILGSKFRQQFHIHGKDWESLHKFINPEILTSEYGGSKKEFSFEKMYDYLYTGEDKLKELIACEYST